MRINRRLWKRIGTGVLLALATGMFIGLFVGLYAIVKVLGLGYSALMWLV